MRNFKGKIEEDVLFQKKILRQDMMRLHKTEEEYLTVSNGRFYRNSYLDGKRISKYISAEEKRLLGYLLRRGLYKKRIKVIQNNLRYEEQLLKHYQPYNQNSILEKMSSAYKIGFASIEFLEDEVINSAQEIYQKYSFFSEETFPGHKTVRGDKRRSKSEVIISNLLDEYKVKYQYEEPLYWNEDISYNMQTIAYQNKLPQKILPDFTIKKADGSDIYWEHLGLLSDADYRKKWSDKQLFYFLQGINQGDRLIVTCDDAEGRFDSSIAASIIEQLAREQGDVLF
ncbi:MAG: hypothetical protein IJB73_08935 [Firmicutes bacterium]|nr:hypothetical protein [Bacillota bacterium]